MKILTRLTERFRLHVKDGSFGYNVFVMFVGTTIGQLGGVLLSPVLTRIYSPDMFGVLGAFTAMLSILSVISSLRYELALPLARDDLDSANLLAVCGVSLLATSAFGSLILLLFPNILVTFALDDLKPYRWLLPVGFLAIGAYQVLVYYATRHGDFKSIAQTKIYQGAGGPLSQIGLGIAGAGAWGLIIGFIIGQSLGSGMLFSRLVLKYSNVMKRITLPAMAAIAKRYQRFPLVSSWSGLINAAGSNTILLVIVPIFYSNTIAGFVFLTDRIVGRPLLMVSTSILQVYLGDVGKSLAINPAAIRRRFLSLAIQQFTVVATWLVIVNALAPFLFPLLFGQEWSEAVPYLQVLSIAYLPQMVMHALVHTLQVLEKQALSAAWETGRLIAVMGAFIISYVYGHNALQALLAYSIAQALAHIVLFILMYHSIKSLQKADVNV